MIQFYRITGFLLLIASSASLSALLARLIQDMREPAFWVTVLLALGLGIAGTIIYFTRNPESKEWVLLLALISSILAAILIGGLTQWGTR